MPSDRVLPQPGTPQRIQRRRSKGWRMPEGAVYVGRPSKWGNPFELVPARSWVNGPLDMWAVTWLGTTLVRFDEKEDAAADAVDRFRRRIDERDRVVLLRSREEIRTALTGKDLACWCPLSFPCHADVLLGIANADA